MNVTQRMVDMLNDAMSRDHEALHTLFRYYVPINEDLADHPEIQVRGFDPSEGCHLSVVGLLNGFAAIKGMRIFAHYEDKVHGYGGGLIGFTCAPIGEGPLEDWEDAIDESLMREHERQNEEGL